MINDGDSEVGMVGFRRRRPSAIERGGRAVRRPHRGVTHWRGDFATWRVRATHRECVIRVRPGCTRTALFANWLCFSKHCWIYDWILL